MDSIIKNKIQKIQISNFNRKSNERNYKNKNWLKEIEYNKEFSNKNINGEMLVKNIFKKYRCEKNK